MANEKTLKVKFKLNQLEFELEGAPKDVKEQYNDFKSFVLNDLMPKINFEDRPTQPQTLEKGAINQLPEAQHVNTSTPTVVPSLKEIKLRDLAKTEADWLVVYCYLASKHGTDEFTRADIGQLYKDSDRHTTERMSHLWQYMKNASLSGVIKPTNNTHFILLEKGRQRALDIFAGHLKAPSAKSKVSGKSTMPKPVGASKEVQKGGSKAAPKAASKGASRKFDFDLDRNLNFRPDGKPSLKDFSAKYQMDSTPKRITVIVHYLLSILKMEKVSGDHIYTGLEELGGKIPPSLRQIIINTKGRDYGWIDYESMDNITLSIQGSNALKDELLKK